VPHASEMLYRAESPPPSRNWRRKSWFGRVEQLLPVHHLRPRGERVGRPAMLTHSAAPTRKVRQAALFCTDAGRSERREPRLSRAIAGFVTLLSLTSRGGAEK